MSRYCRGIAELVLPAQPQGEFFPGSGSLPWYPTRKYDVGFWRKSLRCPLSNFRCDLNVGVTVVKTFDPEQQDRYGSASIIVVLGLALTSAGVATKKDVRRVAKLAHLGGCFYAAAVVVRLS